MQLSKTIETLFNQTASCHPDIIRTLDHAEHNIELDYRGRYILELIQNARDAAMASNALAKVKIILQKDRLLVANNGLEFNDQGLRSICRIGLSTKTDLSFIGHKGLGFKSILEITEKPEIVTKSGTVVFDRDIALTKLNTEDLKANDLPLLFLPMFKPVEIDEYSEIIGDGFSTLIVLPFKPGITLARVREDLGRIRISSFPLLGHFESLVVKDDIDDSGSTIYNVRDLSENVCEIQQGSKASQRLRVFKHDFYIDKDIFDSLPEDEKKLLSPDTPLEIKLALWVDEKDRFKPIANAPLYLFYPLDEDSGFSFIIHSYFVVTPNRKGLLESSPLNVYLMTELVKLLTTTFLVEIKKEFPDQVAEILAFRFNKQGSFFKYGFYDKIVAAQKQLSIIWSDKLKKHIPVSDLYVASETQLNLFSDGFLGGKTLYKKEESYVGSWIETLLKGTQLNNSIIRDHIEEYSEAQQKKGNILFFQNLYLYTAKSQLNLKNKKVLITESNELLSSESEVYYGGQRTEINIPEELKETITFFHNGIKIDKFRTIEEYIGAVEFKTEHLVKRILKHLKANPEQSAPYLFILRDLKLEAPLLKDIIEGIKVPVGDSIEWISPLYTPVYFYSEEIEHLYPEAKFVNFQPLLEVDNDEKAWRAFLKENNVWSAPAVFLKPINPVSIKEHLAFLNSTTSIELRNDVILDKPKEFNFKFQELVLENYNAYAILIYKINTNWPFKVGVKSIDPMKFSSFSFSLRSENWISPQNYAGRFITPSELLVLPVYDEQQTQIRVLRKYFPIFFASDSHAELLRNSGAILARGLSASTAIQLFKWARGKYENIPQETDFSSAWNRLYGFFFEHWKTLRSDSERNTLLKEFRELDLLAERIVNERKRLEWKSATEILYIDDKPFYDCLPVDIRLDLPGSFTKRDRNEIGTVLSKTGLVLSDKINRSLIPPTDAREYNLISKWQWVTYALPLVEQKLSLHIDDETLNVLRQVKLTFVEKLYLEIEVLIGEGSKFNQGIPFYLEDNDKQYNLLFKEGSRNKDAVFAVHELLEEILKSDFDIRLELQELSKIKSEEEAFAVLNNLNIDIERAKEINELISTRRISERLSFWNAFAQAIGVKVEDDESAIGTLFQRFETRVPKLSYDKIVEFDKQIRFDNDWSESILGLFKDLFLLSNVTIQSFNSYSSKKIDISSINRNKLFVLIRDRKLNFVQTLYELLLNNEDKQKWFLNFIDSYSNLPDNLEYNSFNFDEERTLNNHINSIFQEIEGSQTNVELSHKGMSETDLYNDQRSRLVVFATNNNIPIERVNSLLVDQEVKSILCFDFNKITDMLVQSVTIPTDSDPEPPTVSSNAVNEFPIENNSPQLPTSPTGSIGRKGGGGKGGWGRKNSQPTQETLNEIGYNGEYYIFKKLSENYKSVEWVSKNAEKAKVVVSGDDTLGYDIQYVNEQGELTFVEVKATSGITRQFNLTKYEVEKGIANKHNYYVYFVTNALNMELTRGYNLGTIFKEYDTIEEFENSSTFRVESNGYLVTFN